MFIIEHHLKLINVIWADLTIAHSQTSINNMNTWNGYVLIKSRPTTRPSRECRGKSAGGHPPSAHFL